ncbi:MAG: polyamine ABC transporter substrate-binding protein [Rhodospirillales bacterium]
MRRSGMGLRMLVAAVLVLAATLAHAAGGTVRVYNWSDYIDPEILIDFEAKTGIKVVYDVFDSNDILETKLLAGSTGYDVVFPSGNFLARQIQAGIFQPLDKARLPNWQHLDADIMAKVAAYDPDNRHAVVYMWGTSGLAFNAERIAERMADAPTGSWAMLFDSENAARFADCGIFVLDAPDEVIPAALNFLGEDPNAKTPEALAAAETLLKTMRPLVRKFHSSENINALAAGDICLAMMWSGDAKIAAARAEEAGKDFTVDYVIPLEGAQLWFDLMAIPRDAPNPDAAYAFINYLMEPEVIAKATNYVSYPNANAASKPFVDEALRNDPGVYPPPEVMARLFVIRPADLQEQRQLTRTWQRILTGR